MSLNKEIGGYFELELRQGKEYHSSALRLNTGRNAFGYILIANGYSKVYLPYYTCDVMLEPIKKLDLTVEFYHIDSEFRPVFDFSKVNKNEVFVYTNYFGLCDVQVKEISEVCENLIIDNAQAFFSKPLPNVDTFYSPRKFFGVPDGAYLYTTEHKEIEMGKDFSHERFSHLLGRTELGAEAFFGDFKKNEEKLKNQEIKRMSILTQKILGSIDYRMVNETRIRNFAHLHSSLEKKNQLVLTTLPLFSPLIYPFLPKNRIERTVFWKQKIFVPQYWPNVLKWSEEGSFEWNIAKDLICLPLDQRITPEDLEEMVKICLNENKNSQA